MQYPARCIVELDLPKALTGTSMATPLVSGLAEYLWTLAPDLSAPQLRNALLAAASTPVAGCARFSRPIVDAYAATLSFDQTVSVTPETAPSGWRCSTATTTATSTSPTCRSGPTC